MSMPKVVLVLGIAGLLSGVSHAVDFKFCVRRNPVGSGVKDGARITLRAACKPSEIPLPVSFDETAKTVRVTGADLQVVSGSGSTTGTVNGLGNLIVGYDEGNPVFKTGSHNLIVGPFIDYGSYGGFATGHHNFLS